MLAPHKLLIFSAIAVMIFSNCTVINKMPDQANTVNEAVNGAQDSPTGQLAAMHGFSSKVDVAWVVQYYRLINTVSAKILNDEFDRTSNDFTTGKTEWNQWQLAMLLSLPWAPFYDPERSSLLFNELKSPSANHDPVINDVAFLMYSWVKEQRQANKRAADLEAQLAKSKSANKTLQEQLDALKAIEENLYQRNKVEVQPKP